MSPSDSEHEKDSREDSGTEHSAEMDSELARLIGDYADRLAEREAGDPTPAAAAEGDGLPELEAEIDTMDEIQSLVLQHSPPARLGPYKLIRLLGHGGMGDVFLAWQEALGRPVALKVLSHRLLEDKSARKRFDREARVAAGLHHPNIVPVFDLGVDSGWPYYAMELVEGETLREIHTRVQRSESGDPVVLSPAEIQEKTLSTLWLIASSSGALKGNTPGSGLPVIPTVPSTPQTPDTGPEESPRMPSGESTPPEPPSGDLPSPPADDSVEVGSQPLSDPSHSNVKSDFYRWLAVTMAGVADGLNYAHNHKVFHRDVKPSNLMLDENGRCRILDFGLAWVEDDMQLTRSGQFVGTIPFMSPEQAQGGHENLTAGSDIYSLGATIYYMLAGQPVFRGSSYKETIEQIHHDDPAPLRRVNGHVPRDVETIVMKCLRKTPRDRYLTAEALAQDLRRYARGEPIEARPVPPWLRVLDRLWRRRARILQAAALCVILAAVGLITANVFHERAQDRLRRYGSLLCQAEARRLEPRPTHASLGFGSSGGLPSEIPEARAMPKWETANSCFVIPWVADAGPMVADTVSSSAHEALRLLEQAQDLRPGDPRVPRRLALTYLTLGLEDEAREQAAAAARLDPGARETIALLRLLESRGIREPHVRPRPTFDDETETWIGTWTRAEGAVLDGDWEQAADGFEDLLSLREESEKGEPSHVGNLLARAVALFQGGKPASAIGVLGVARVLWESYEESPVEPDLLTARVYLQTEPDSADSQFQDLFERVAEAPEGVREVTALRIADIYQQHRNYSAALGWVDRVEKKGPGTLRKRAELLYFLGEHQEALEAARKAVALEGDGENVAARVVLGNIRRSLGDREGALASYEEAARLAPEDPRCLVARGLAMEDTGKTAEAMRDFTKAAEASPWYSAAYFHLARLHEKEGDADTAEEAFKEALKRNPRDSLAAHGLGLLYLRQHRLTEAEELFSRAILCDPGLASAHYNRAWLLFLANRYEEAVVEYETAIERGLDNPIVQNNLGAARHSLCDFSYAIPHFKGAIDGRRDLDAAQLNLANAILKIFGAGEAVPHFERALNVAADSTHAHRLLGLATRELYVDEARKRSLESYRESVRLDPSNGYALQEFVEILNRFPVYLPPDEGLADDIRLLEDRLASPGAGPLVREFLKTLRERHLPRLASLASVDWYLDRTAETWIDDDTVWWFCKGKEPPSDGAEWMDPAFLPDGKDGWERAPGGFGMGEDTREVVQTYLSDMQGQYSSVFLRHQFTVTRAREFGRLVLEVCSDDGFVAYLNGKEVGRFNVGSGHEFSLRHSPDIPVNAMLVEVQISPTLCREGDNILAIHAINRSVDDHDFCIAARLEAFPGPQASRDRELLETFRRENATWCDPALGKYLQARILQRRGEHEAAITEYEKVMSEAPSRAEPVLRLAECLSARGEPQEGLKRIVKAIRESRAPRRALWDRWWKLNVLDLGQSVEATLAAFPSRPGSEPGGREEDLRWALNQLRQYHAIRINCGGPDYVHEGKHWGRDRFHRGGWPYTGYLPTPSEILKTQSDPLYQTEHIWEGGHQLDDVTYSIPIPPGKYSLTLHFAELWHYGEGERCFDVLVEGQPLLYSLDPLAAAGGRGTALALGGYPVAVEDTSLDIRLREIRGHAQICAIEITRK